MTPDEQKAQGEQLLFRVKPLLTNLDVCNRVCGVLLPYVRGDEQPPGLQIAFLPGPTIRGMNTGVFTTPVILSALVDARKMLSFFGLAARDGKLEPYRGKRPDDLDITNLGLSSVSPTQYLKVLSPKISEAALLTYVCSSMKYVNKEVAHLTKVAPNIDFSAILATCDSVESATRKFVCEPLGLPYPNTQIVDGNG